MVLHKTDILINIVVIQNVLMKLNTSNDRQHTFLSIPAKE